MLSYFAPSFDAYPQRFNCAAPDVWQSLNTDYHFYHEGEPGNDLLTHI